MNSRIIASRALRPCQGSEAACAWSPWNVTSTSSLASRPQVTWVMSERMEQERRVEVVEQAVLDHRHLARAALLGGRAQEHDLAGQLRRDGGEGDRRPDARCRHRVVAAAMAQPRQGVVFGEDPDSGPVAAGRPAPGRHRAAARGPPSARLPAGCSTAKPWARIASAIHVDAWTSSKAGSGLAWIRWLRAEDLVPVRLDDRRQARP